MKRVVLISIMCILVLLVVACSGKKSPDKGKVAQTPDISNALVPFMELQSEGDENKKAVKPGDSVEYFGTGHLLIRFEGEVKPDDVKANLKLDASLSSTKRLDIQVEKSNETTIYIDLTDVDGTELPQSFSITLKKGLSNSKGKSIISDITLKFIKKKEPEAEVSLIDSANKKLKYNMSLSNTNKRFLVEFKKPMDRASVELVIKSSIIAEEGKKVPAPKITYLWKSDTELIVSVSGLKAYVSYGVNLFGAKDMEGGTLSNGGYMFITQEPQYVWSCNIESGAKNKVATFDYQTYCNGSMSPSGEWLSMMRFTNAAGEGGSGVPILYNVKNQSIKELEEETSAMSLDNRWSKTSDRLLIDSFSIYTISDGKTQKIDASQPSMALGSKFSPDGSKVAVFTFKDSEDGKVNPTELSIANNSGAVQKRYVLTNILPEIEENYVTETPLIFEWSSDNVTLYSESWDTATGICSVFSINTDTGLATQLIKNAHTPKLSPDGKSLATFSMTAGKRKKNIDIVQITDLVGTVLFTSPTAAYKVGTSTVDQIMWSQDSMKLVLMCGSGAENARKNWLFKWDLAANAGKKVDIENNTMILWVNQDGSEVNYMN